MPYVLLHRWHFKQRAELGHMVFFFPFICQEIYGGFSCYQCHEDVGIHRHNVALDGNYDGMIIELLRENLKRTLTRKAKVVGIKPLDEVGKLIKNRDSWPDCEPYLTDDT